MICMHCSTAQPAAQDCQNCYARLAKYYCDKVAVCCISLSYFSSVIYGMTRQQSRSIIVLIAEYVVLEKDLGRTSFIARFVLIRGRH
jgi:hypothetical protein